LSAEGEEKKKNWKKVERKRRYKKLITNKIKVG
jgi:hypothetical protein